MGGVVSAVKGFINHFVPFGRHITGAHAERQKRLHSEALNRYNTYAGEAKRNIENLSRSLQQSVQNLQSLEQQQYYSQQKASQLYGQIGQYESNLANLEQRKSQAAGEAEHLKSVFEGFKSKLPAMEQRVSQVQNMPSEFQSLFDTVTRQKERLRGLSPEEAEGEIRKYREDVENLKKTREETEKKIRSAMTDITGQHQGLSTEKAALEQRLDSYKLKQEQLLQEGSSFAGQKNVLQQAIGNYNQEQQKLAADYAKQQADVRAQQEQLKNYIASSQQQLDALGSEVNSRASKYRRDTGYAGLAQGALLGGLTMGLGGGWPAALGVGGMAYLGRTSTASRLGVVEGTTLGNGQSAQGGGSIGGFDLGMPKQQIPELGSLKQALSHFNMPSVPKLKDLPRLHEALGKIPSPQDIESLSLGLPSMTSASGKKYSAAVLYDPDFIKKLKKVSRILGQPYLRQHSVA